MEKDMVSSRPRRRTVMIAAAAGWLAASGAARAEGGLDSGGMTFKDFAVMDNGASFGKDGDPMSGSRTTPSRLLSVDNGQGLARVRFDTVKVVLSLPLGWHASEDWERGLAQSGDRQYRALVWRLDFAFEGVNDAEHYAATKAGSIKARRRNVETQARKLADGTFLVVYDKVAAGPTDSEPRIVFDLVTPKPGSPKEGVLLTLGLPGRDAERGLRLLALLKEKMKIDW